jgi:hypothetical protein
MTHQKTDLLTDEQLAAFKTAAGDVLTLDVPDSEGKLSRGEHVVTAVEIQDIGEYDGKHYTRVTLTLEG